MYVTWPLKILTVFKPAIPFLRIYSKGVGWNSNKNTDKYMNKDIIYNNGKLEKYSIMGSCRL